MVMERWNNWITANLLAAHSAELEPGPRLDGVLQLVLERALVPELWQFEEVHAGASGGQAVGLGARVLDAERRVQLLNKMKIVVHGFFVRWACSKLP